MSQQVSVICLCYNHAKFVREAIESIFSQTYSNIQLIVVDDASTDNSIEVIRQLTIKYPSIQFISLDRNVGNCAAFNRGLGLATGEFLVDFAADDIFAPDRIEKQVGLFQKLGGSYGVIFTDASYINEQGNVIRNHYEYLVDKGLVQQVPQGDVFSAIISKYFVASPTMMVRKSVLDQINGYDENLSYEDFDFWVRSSRICMYGFLNEKLTFIRKSDSSMSRGWYKIGDTQVHSTYLVCRKIISMIRTDEEKQSLLKRLRYELRQCAFSHNRIEAQLFFSLIQEVSEVRIFDRLLLLISKSRLPIAWLRNLYHWFRYS